MAHIPDFVEQQLSITIRVSRY